METEKPYNSALDNWIPIASSYSGFLCLENQKENHENHLPRGAKWSI